MTVKQIKEAEADQAIRRQARACEREESGREAQRLLWWFRHPFSTDLEAVASTNS